MSVKMFFCVFVYLYVIFTSSSIDGQVCTHRVVVPVTTFVMKTWTYRETYMAHGQCSRARPSCILVRTGKRTLQVPITTNKVQIEESCCPGYIRRESNANSSIICEPICVPSCGNGYCQSPGKCACNPAYTADPDDAHNCLPVCHDGCVNGLCIYPDTCLCNFGYISESGVCKPVCTEPCINAICSAPETCTCDPGYRLFDRTCEADCPTGCSGGRCISPGTCVCHEGYDFLEGNCVSSCNPGCNPVLNRNGSSANGDCNCTDEWSDTTTTEISLISQRYDDDEATDVTEGSSSEAFTDFEASSTLSAAAFDTNDTVIKDQRSRVLEYWPLAILTVCLLVLLVAGTVILFKWKSIFIYFKGSSYSIEEDKDDMSAVASQFETVKFSAICKAGDTPRHDVV